MCQRESSSLGNSLQGNEPLASIRNDKFLITWANTAFQECRVQLKPDGTRWLTGGGVKGKLANGVGGQYSQTTSEHGVSSITTVDAHTSAASSRPNWRPRRLKWTRPFRRKTKSGFCACAITFQTQSNTNPNSPFVDLWALRKLNKVSEQLHKSRRWQWWRFIT
jgi:hypothetical protein